MTGAKLNTGWTMDPHGGGFPVEVTQLADGRWVTHVGLDAVDASRVRSTQAEVMGHKPRKARRAKVVKTHAARTAPRKD